MKYRTWINRGFRFGYKVNLLDDVLDIKRFTKRTFSSFKDLFKIDRERKAKKLAKDIFTDFLKLLADDLAKIESKDFKDAVKTKMDATLTKIGGKKAPVMPAGYYDGY